MAEIAAFQTAAAAIEDAKSIANEVHDRIDRLGQVLDGVKHVLGEREDTQASTAVENEAKAKKRIHESIQACGTILEQNDEKVYCSGRGPAQNSELGLKQRVNIALRERSISRFQGEVEAHIHVLHLNLDILQVLDQNVLRSQAKADHAAMLGALRTLGREKKAAEVSFAQLRLHQRDEPSSQSAGNANPGNQTSGNGQLLETIGGAAASALSGSIGMAAVVYEKYSAEYFPSDSSEKERENLIRAGREWSSSQSVYDGAGRELPSFGIAGDAAPTPSRPSTPAAEEQTAPRAAVPALDILNDYIKEYEDAAKAELARSLSTEAEMCFSEAIQCSEMRQTKYGVQFQDMVQLNESLADVQMKGCKWLDAVVRVRQLLSESSESAEVQSQLALARQNQLLACIYLDRCQRSPDRSSQDRETDLETAETYAQAAHRKRDDVFKSEDGSQVNAQEKARQRECMQLLVQILDAQGKGVKANVFRKQLAPCAPSLDDVSLASESLPRVSTATSRQATESSTEYEMVGDGMTLLAEAISNGNNSQLGSLLSTNNLDVDRLSKDERTAVLLCAVEQNRENNRSGAEVDAKGEHGQTALQVAASTGNVHMIDTLLGHNAHVNATDHNGETALLKAVQSDHVGAFKALVERDADLEVVYRNDFTILHHAVHHGSTEITKLILDRAPELKGRMDCRKLTALHHCASQEYPEQAAALLQHPCGVNVDPQDPSKRTPLFFVASKASTLDRSRLVGLLLKHRANPDNSRYHKRFDDYPALRQHRIDSEKRKMTRNDSVRRAAPPGGDDSYDGTL
ncbi:hypothetical protein LTR85_008437 [Meristemomyces frigidus]|nr:hypothetical protein LTR85_008437 [Meristemomyces frigidus]